MLVEPWACSRAVTKDPRDGVRLQAYWAGVVGADELIAACSLARGNVVAGRHEPRCLRVARRGGGCDADGHLPVECHPAVGFRARGLPLRCSDGEGEHGPKIKEEMIWLERPEREGAGVIGGRAIWAAGVE